jgi:hypothetical protein
MSKQQELEARLQDVLTVLQSVTPPFVPAGAEAMTVIIELPRYQGLPHHQAAGVEAWRAAFPDTAAPQQRCPGRAAPREDAWVRRRQTAGPPRR